MRSERTVTDVVHNLLNYGHLSFRDFMEVALYHPAMGYYVTGAQRVGKEGDFVTAPTLSPLFSYAIAGLVREFVRRCEGAVCSIVDIGCGDGGLIRDLARQAGAENVRFFGIDRSLERIPESEIAGAVRYMKTVDEIPRDGCHFVFSNELFDAIPFARLVQRHGELHELWIGEVEGGGLDWVEHEAPPSYAGYFEERAIELAEGQFADVSLEWGALYGDIARHFERALIVTCDYGYPGSGLFHPRARRFGTAAAYAGQRVSRDLLASPGEQDLTAHINFTDLEQAGHEQGAVTLFFDRLAKFLLALGAADHEIFRPVEEAGITTPEEGVAWLERREEARRLILPDGIGEDLRVLVQAKGMGEGEWGFQRKLF